MRQKHLRGRWTSHSDRGTESMALLASGFTATERCFPAGVELCTHTACRRWHAIGRRGPEPRHSFDAGDATAEGSL